MPKAWTSGGCCSPRLLHARFAAGGDAHHAARDLDRPVSAVVLLEGGFGPLAAHVEQRDELRRLKGLAREASVPLRRALRRLRARDHAAVRLDALGSEPLVGLSELGVWRGEHFNTKALSLIFRFDFQIRTL